LCHSLPATMIFSPSTISSPQPGQASTFCKWTRPKQRIRNLKYKRTFIYKIWFVRLPNSLPGLRLTWWQVLCHSLPATMIFSLSTISSPQPGHFSTFCKWTCPKQRIRDLEGSLQCHVGVFLHTKFSSWSQANLMTSLVPFFTSNNDLFTVNDFLSTTRTLLNVL
jgi:hypothetical protein